MAKNLLSGKPQSWTRGAVVVIPPGDGFHAYGQKLEDPEYAFFGLRTTDDLSPEDVDPERFVTRLNLALIHGVFTITVLPSDQMRNLFLFLFLLIFSFAGCSSGTTPQEFKEGRISNKRLEIRVGLGSGSCRGEGTATALVVRLHNNSEPSDKLELESGIPVVYMSEEEAEVFQEKLQSYVRYFQEHGECPPNFWKVYSVDIRTPQDPGLKRIFFGYCSPYDEKGPEFETWIRQVAET